MMDAGACMSQPAKFGLFTQLVRSMVPRPFVNAVGPSKGLKQRQVCGQEIEAIDARAFESVVRLHEADDESLEVHVPGEIRP